MAVAWILTSDEGADVDDHCVLIVVYVHRVSMFLAFCIFVEIFCSCKFVVHVNL